MFKKDYDEAQAGAAEIQAQIDKTENEIERVSGDAKGTQEKEKNFAKKQSR